MKLKPKSNFWNKIEYFYRKLYVTNYEHTYSNIKKKDDLEGLILFKTLSPLENLGLIISVALQQY